ncbi:MAG: DUF2993 domain-containing protein [Elainella sp. Prado103]|jgi:hypothetical protein|nr:DUF2993 domain-containing protein [Elainella sp. Prado103]
MEFLTIVLSGLLGLLSPVGFGIEQVAQRTLRSQLEDVETLTVRIDNTPNWQIAQGRVDRIRIAGRGISPIADLRIDTLEIETDPIALQPASLRSGNLQLEQPLNAGIRLVLSRDDLNRALQSPAFMAQFRDLNLDALGAATQPLDRYDLVQPQLEFLEHDRLRFQVTLQAQQSATQLAIEAETGIRWIAGRQLELVEPTVTINERSLPPQLLALLLGGISQQLDLSRLESQGITARVLAWDIQPDRIELATFVRVDPSFTID